MKKVRQIGQKIFLKKEGKKETRLFINDLVTKNIPFFYGRNNIVIKEDDLKKYNKLKQTKTTKWIFETHRTLVSKFGDQEFETKDIKKETDWGTSIPVRISELRKEGLITDRPNKTDRRKKVYRVIL